VDADKILLIHHRKLNKWLQPGGHCDGDTDTLAVAIKEVEEETGVVIKPNDQVIIDLDIHRIPERKGIPAHDHYDVRYLLEADSSLPLLQNHETLDTPLHRRRVNFESHPPA
jgi:8-oxo-dGTP pyrophosphatase MutT (NUDIX family)